jgi:hypothetical protein
VGLGRDDQATSDGYDGALITFPINVIYGPPAECNTRLHSSLYYTQCLNNEHPWCSAGESRTDDSLLMITVFMTLQDVTTLLVLESLLDLAVRVHAEHVANLFVIIQIARRFKKHTF